MMVSEHTATALRKAVALARLSEESAERLFLLFKWPTRLTHKYTHAVDGRERVEAHEERVELFIWDEF